jgi:hypothetical protein
LPPQFAIGYDLVPEVLLHSDYFVDCSIFDITKLGIVMWHEIGLRRMRPKQTLSRLLQVV